MKSAWTHIFETLAYAGAGDLEITAETIKQCGKTWTGKANQFEPRLLCYQSSDRDRPEIFKQYILEEPITHGPLLNGRHRISIPSMKLGEKTIAISGVQYETDACFETLNKILIIECKTNTKEISSFNIRQLFFPYSAVRQHTEKEIVCAFIHELSNRIHVWTYDFVDPLAIESIELKKKFIFKII